MSAAGDTPSSERPLLPRYQPLVIVLAAVVAGILSDRYAPLEIGLWGLLGIVSLGCWWFLRWKDWNRLAGMAILTACGTLGGAWHHCQWQMFAADDLGNFVQEKKQPVCLRAKVLRGPRPLPPPSSDTVFPTYYEPGSRLQIEALAIRDRAKWIPISGRADVVVQGETPPPVEAGDRIQILGQISALPRALNPGEFDYAAYARSRRVRARIHCETPECVSVLERGSKWNLIRILERFRRSSAKVLENYLDPRQAELASAILLGEREQLDAQRNEAFMATGTIHVLSISGLHVGILAGVLLWLIRRVPLPRGIGLVLVAAVTGAYALLVDVEPPVVRATVIVLLFCLSLWLYRPILSFNTLAAAALVVLAINPSDLFHVGAQLSFLCVGVLIWFGRYRTPMLRSTLDLLVESHRPLISRQLRRWARYFWSLFLAGAALWLIATPLVMARFHLCSPVALVLNPILWIPMTLGLFFGFLMLLCNAVFPPLAGVCAALCNLNLWVIEKAIHLAQQVPGSHFWVSGPTDWWLAVFYGTVVFWAALPQYRPKPRWCAALFSLWIAVGWAASWAHPKDAPLQCTFLAVGHGTAVVVELPDGQTLLYDAGQKGAPRRSANIVSNFLWSRGITRLDAVVLSHADLDHYNALPTLLNRFSVGTVYVSPVMFRKPSRMIDALHDVLTEQAVPVRAISAGDQLGCGAACRIEVLYPPHPGLPASDNANSMVLKIEYAGKSILLPGDLEPPGLEALLSEAPSPCTVLMAPHHGSQKSNSPPLAQWCRPRWVVLSGDGQWSTAKTDAAYRAVGGQTLHTYRSGAILFDFEPEKTKVRTFLTTPKYEDAVTE